MPELAEIHSYARNINEWSEGVLFDSITKMPTGKGPDISLDFTGKYSIFAQARGKELMLTLTKESNGSVFKVTFRHGLVGIWQCEPTKSIPKHTHIYFSSLSSGKSICFVDSNRLGTWNRGSFDIKERGPDPINEFNDFRKNFLAKVVNNTKLNKQICEVLLDQKFFNGIGNYLRAEILYRARINPLTNTRELVLSNSEAVNRMLSLCRTVPLEVFTLKLNKYGSKEEKAKFNDWLQVYGKSKFDTVKGRKIYYKSNQHLLKPDDDIVIPLEPHQASSYTPKSQVSQKPAIKKKAISSLPPPKREFRSTPREKDVKKMLLASSLLWQSKLISKEEKDWIKNSAFKGDDLVFCALEAFYADDKKDVNEFAENIHLMFELANSRDASIFF